MSKQCGIFLGLLRAQYVACFAIKEKATLPVLSSIQPYTYAFFFG